MQALRTMRYARRLWSAMFEAPPRSAGTGGPVARLFLLRKPRTDGVNPVENKPPNFDAWRADSAGSQALQSAYRAVQLPSQIDFADIPMEHRSNGIGRLNQSVARTSQHTNSYEVSRDSVRESALHSIRSAAFTFRPCPRRVALRACPCSRLQCRDD